MLISTETIKLLKYVWYCLWTQNPLKIRCYFIATILFLLFSILVNLSVPFFLKQIIMSLSNTSNYFALSITLLVLSYAGIWGFAQMLDAFRRKAIIIIDSPSTVNFSVNLFTHLQDLSVRYHMDRKTGSIVSAYEQIRWAYPEFIEIMFCSIIPLMIEVVLTVSILSYYYSISFGAALLVMFVLYNALVYYTSNKIVACRQIQNECNMAANTCIVDSLLNAETVKLLNTQEYEAQQALDKLSAKEEADCKMLNTDAKIHLGQNLIVGITLMFMTLVAGQQVWQGKINISDFIFIYGYLFIFMTPLSQLGYSIRQARDFMTRMQLAMDILDKPIEILDLPNAPQIRVGAGNIRFENVSFAYNADRSIIRNISFDVPAGKTVAIVGATGSGKSTISRLLFRLYNLDSGKIIIDGQDIAAVTKGSLRESMGIVPQDSILFNDDLRSNIIYGKPDFTDAELSAAIKDAELESVIAKLPKQLDSIVGERGLKLSGGEKQRVAIARMIIKRPKIMVFDEATSSLDVIVERQIQNNIREISKNITTLIIAHRLSTITYADLILVMDQGEIKERGTHDELLAHNGLYTELWQHQLYDSSH